MTKTTAMRIGASVLGVAVLAIAAVAPASAELVQSQSESDTTVIGGAEVDRAFGIYSAKELDEFLLSDTPKTVTLDMSSGEVVSVEQPGVISPMAYVGTTCSSSNFCLLAASAPYANAAFTGAGRNYGTYSNKRGYRTGSWIGQGWWLYGGNLLAGARLGPNSTALLNGSATFTMVRLWLPGQPS